MNIKFNEVTWYSKSLAVVIFFVIVPVLFFLFGSQYAKVKYGFYDDGARICYTGDPFGEGRDSAQKEFNNDLAMCKSSLSSTKEEFANLYSSKFPVLNFKCDGGRKFNVQYGSSSYSPGPGTIYIPHYGLYLYLESADKDFPEFLSEISHTSNMAQYQNYDKKVFFQTNFDKAFIKQNGITTHKNCMVVE